MKKLTVANGLTSFRLVGAVGMLLLEPLSTAFYVVYTLSGISDGLDGPVARCTHTASAFGAKLDSVADLVFYSVMLLRLLPILQEAIPQWIWIWVGGIVALRVCIYILAAIKFGKFASLHTWMNKLTGAMLFAVPYLLRQTFFAGYCIALCAVATMAAAWEMSIHLRTGKIPEESHGEAEACADSQ